MCRLVLWLSFASVQALQGQYVDIANAVEKAYRAKLVRWLKSRRS